MDHLPEIERLQKAIAALEAQRDLLGDEVVETALSPLRQQLRALQAGAPELRKLVTILFADLVGFTPLTEKLDAEDVREILKLYFEAWSATITSYGGSVEKYIGDAVMAVFGLHRAREDDPENAIRAALAMRPALESLNRRLERRWPGVELVVRAAVHTGPVVAAAGDQGLDFVVVGDTVNLASRLQSAAPPNGLLISHAAYRHVRGLFFVSPLEPFPVKGFSDPVQAYLVEGEKQRRFRIPTRGVEGIETTLIGREAELQSLQSAYLAAGVGRECQWLLLSGEAGLGKSRLLSEFDAWMELRPELIRYFKGRAAPAMQNRPYALLRDAFAARFQILDSDPPDTVCARLAAGLRGLPPPQDGEVVAVELDERTRVIGRLLGFDLGPQGEPGAGTAGAGPASAGTAGAAAHPGARALRDRGLVYLADYFLRLAGEGPVALLFEDLHWADDSSLAAIEHLALGACTAAAQQAEQPAALLILCTARPVFFERVTHWTRPGSGCRHIELLPLSLAASAELVDEILQKVAHLPAELRDRVIAQAEGNPFYIEELIKVLIEDGVIRKGAESWTIDAGRLQDMRIPPTLTAVLQARLDSLALEERLTLQHAAVIGRVFWDRAVAGLEEQDSLAQTERYLADLRRRELVFLNPGSSFEDTVEYAFKHALLRDVTYETLLKRDRRRYHHKAAGWLEGITRRSRRTEEYAALIAGHYQAAGLPEQAADWYWRAGQHAAAHFANAEALRCFNLCLALAPPEDPSSHFEILAAREAVHDLLGDRAAQEADLAALKALAAGASGDAHLQTVALWRSANYAEKVGDYTATEDYARQTIALAQETGSRELEIRGYLYLGISFWRRALYAEARPPLETALELARRAGLPVLEADILRSLGIVFEGQSDYSAARRAFTQALEINRRLGDRRGEAMCLNSLGATAYYEYDLAAAREFLLASWRLKRLIGDRRGQASTLVNLGLVALLLNTLQAAIDDLDQAREISTTIDDLGNRVFALSALGMAKVALGAYDDARAHLELALSLGETLADPEVDSDSLATLSLLHLRTGDPERALELSRRALVFAEQVGTFHQTRRAWIFQGHALAALGRPAEAGEAYRQALAAPGAPAHDTTAREAHAGLVRLALAADEPARARAAAEPILGALENAGWTENALHGMDEPYLVHYSLYRALAETPGPDAAAQAARLLAWLQHHLRAQAGQIRDPGLQRSFLEGVQAHRAILSITPPESQSPAPHGEARP